MRFVNPIPVCALLVVASCAVLETESNDNIGERQSEIEVCSTGPTTFGIDVSRYQGNIDWSQVAGAGVKFAYIQISRKIDDIDAKFEVNWAGAKANGILRGAYQRFQPEQSVQGQADIFLEKLGPFEPGDLPPMLDVEDDGGLSPAAIAQSTRQWLEIVEAATGVRPIIYTGRYFWQDKLASADFTEYPLWIAHYTTGCPNIPAPWTSWALHQYSSSAVLPGITANTVDVNHFNGTIDDLLALAGTVECGDGVCTGGESTDSCEQDCPPCQRIAAEGGIIDDQGPCFDVGGNPEYMRTELAGLEGKLTWTHTTDSPQAANYGRWNLFLDDAGKYLVEAHTPAPFGMSTQAGYQIAHGGQETVSEIDQSAIDGWSPLGEFDFAQGGSQSIRVDDNTGESNETNTKLVFDAIRLTRLDLPDVGGEEPEPDLDEDEGDAEGGCQSSGSGGGPAGALLIVALLLGRQWWRRSTF